MEKRYNNTSTRKNQMGKNGVRDVNWRWIPIFVGVIIGLLLPFFVDMVLFNTPFPCKTVETYNNGNSLQKCEVRR